MKNLTLLLSFAIIFFCSCSTTKKNKTSHTESTKSESAVKTDSSHTAKNDSSRVKKTRQSNILIKRKEYTKKTTIEFENGKKVKVYSNDKPLLSDSTNSNDYDINIPGIVNKIKASGPVKKITTEEATREGEKQKTESSTVDSSHTATVDTTHLQKTDNKKTETAIVDKAKQVERTSYTGMILFSILFLLLVVTCIIYRKEIKVFLVARKILKSKSVA